MLKYVIKRLGLAIVIAMLSVTLLFIIIHMIPGDPARTMLGPRATPELIADLEVRMGLDKSLPVQIMIFFGNMLRGDLGMDIFSNRPVATIVFEQLPHTLALITASITWSATLGIFLGCFSAVRRNSLADRITGVLAVSFIAAPAFVIALYSLLLFAVKLRWFPAIGAGEPGDWGDQLWHLVLPSFAIGLSWVGYIARLVRASMLEIMGEGHVRTARSRQVGHRFDHNPQLPRRHGLGAREHDTVRCLHNHFRHCQCGSRPPHPTVSLRGQDHVRCRKRQNPERDCRDPPQPGARSIGAHRVDHCVDHILHCDFR